MKSIDQLKKTENETLRTFDEEIPSLQFSHEDDSKFENYLKNYKNFYINNLKFPPEMFRNKSMIDFGAGAGSNSLCLASWGAKCTLVELSAKSLSFAEEVFKKRLKSIKDHRFINSSIFDFNEKELYDIVHCRAVLSHTAGKELAFKKIIKLVNKGGYFIYGDPNKGGGFQNMLQRYLIYKFSKNDKDIVKYSELFFKNDIDRSQKAVARTRNQIIFDRWVIQSQDDPSFKEVCNWINELGLKLYSTYPSNPDFFITDSFYNKDKIDFSKIHNISVLSEILWMTKTEDDKDSVSKIEENLSDVGKSFAQLTSYVANCNKSTEIKTKEFNEYSDEFIKSINNIEFLKKLDDKLKLFINETKQLVEIANNGDIEKAKSFIENCSLLFKGPCGIRHVDFIAYKEN